MEETNKDYDEKYFYQLHAFIDNMKDAVFNQMKEDNPEYVKYMERLYQLEEQRSKVIDKLSEEDKKVLVDFDEIKLQVEILESERLYVNGYLDCIRLLRYLRVIDFEMGREA